MATMNISLPAKMKEWVEKQVASGRYANASDYVRDLIRRDEDAVARLQVLVDEARASGISETPIEELFDRVKARTRAKLKAAARDAA